MSEQDEILNLANLWCEGRLSTEQLARMQSLLRSKGENCSAFVRFLQIHGQLSWEAGSLPSVGSDDELLQVAAIACCSDPDLHMAEVRKVRAKARRVTLRLPVAVAALLLAMCCGWWLGRPQSSATVVQRRRGEVERLAVPVKAVESEDVALPQSGGWRPLQLSGLVNADTAVRPDTTQEVPVASTEPSIEVKELNDATVAAEIDRLLEQSWQENGIQPAADAADHEWVRRAYLVLTGRISTQQEAAEFVQSSDREKRSHLISGLVRDDRTSENLAVIWTNLLIGRSNPRGVNQDALWGFLKGQFAGNRPWMETVGKLIAAEGRSDQQGETNFLLAHLNDQATPATAVTARLFLGRQVQCTQCHDHPFARERLQDEFWTLNAFFKQTVRGEIDADEIGSDMKMPVRTLQDTGSGGMTFYENLRGQQKAVLPEFAGQTLNTEVVSRRAELVRLLDADNEHQVARAMVNRMWSMFFGYGFANPVDDLGIHNPASHPELFDFLTMAFVKSNYDMQRLMLWIAQSKAFGLSSEQQESIAALDDPQEGGVPLFSRSYPRPMGPEQVYDSLRTAIGSVAGRPMDSSVGTSHRREWVEQFVRAWGTDDNEESLELGSNISQALLLMNGEDLQNAIPLAAAQVSRVSGNSPASVSDSLRMIALGTLNREPTDREEKVFRNRYRTLTRSLPPQKAIQTATEDMLWAYLNSSEFVSVH
jgi:hypothetical protein